MALISGFNVCSIRGVGCKKAAVCWLRVASEAHTVNWFGRCLRSHFAAALAWRRPLSVSVRSRSGVVSAASAWRQRIISIGLTLCG